MKGNYRSMSVANYIVNSAIDDGRPVSNLKLQKLLYYVQAASLVEKNMPMFDDQISAWRYGPVVEKVYHAFKYYVNRPITVKNSAGGIWFDEEERINASIDEADMQLIDRVVGSYEGSSALSMVAKTHKEGPWKEAYPHKDYIENEAIRNYYSIHREEIYGESGYQR